MSENKANVAKLGSQFDSRLNRKITVGQAFEILRDIYTDKKLRQQVAVMLVGDTGIGKTAVMRRLAKEVGAAFLPFRLPERQPEDVVGLPNSIELGFRAAMLLDKMTRHVFFEGEPNRPNELSLEMVTALNKASGGAFGNDLIKEFKGKQSNNREPAYENSPSVWLLEQLSSKPTMLQGFSYVPPKMFTAAIDLPAVLGLDEVNRAFSTVVAQVFRVLSERELGDFDIPPHWLVVGAINGGNEYFTEEMDAAFKRRWLWLSVQADASDWLGWARKNAIHPFVTSAINNNPEIIENKPLLVNPASWEKVSDILHFKERHHKKDLYSLLAGNKILANKARQGLLTLLSGYVGQEYAQMVLSKTIDISPLSIFEHPDHWNEQINNLKTLVNSQPFMIIELAYQVQHLLKIKINVGEMTKDRWDNFATNIGALLRETPADMRSAIIHSLIKENPNECCTELNPRIQKNISTGDSKYWQEVFQQLVELNKVAKTVEKQAENMARKQIETLAGGSSGNQP